MGFRHSFYAGSIRSVLSFNYCQTTVDLTHLESLRREFYEELSGSMDQTDLCRNSLDC